VIRAGPFDRSVLAPSTAPQFEPAASTDTSSQAESFGRTDTEQLEAACVGVLGSGRSLSSWATFDISISVDGYASSASPHTPIAQSETATFANGWLTKMIKARLHLQQSGPD
jgi:hypothetical protein